VIFCRELYIYVSHHSIPSFPSHGGLNAIYLAVIEVRLSYGAAGQVVLPATHPEGDVEAIVVRNPVGAIARQPNWVYLHDIVHNT